ncbi:MAG: FAD-dependent oxidoreductase, partial [Candidatus Neomarinimicrobiota bacterium]
MKLSDFKGLFQKQDIKLLEKREYGEDYVEFNFSSETVQDWRAGEHGLFTFPDKKIKGKSFRGFSIASIPEENILKITTRISPNPSSFKLMMKEMEVGDKIRLRGPFGWFTLQDENSPLVLIAAGVGIAPIRALLK